VTWAVNPDAKTVVANATGVGQILVNSAVSPSGNFLVGFNASSAAADKTAWVSETIGLKGASEFGASNFYSSAFNFLGMKGVARTTGQGMNGTIGTFQTSSAGVTLTGKSNSTDFYHSSAAVLVLGDSAGTVDTSGKTWAVASTTLAGVTYGNATLLDRSFIGRYVDNVYAGLVIDSAASSPNKVVGLQVMIPITSTITITAPALRTPAPSPPPGASRPATAPW